jgi:hypothetical protein
LIRISSGTANFGTNTGNSVLTQNNGAFEVSNGTVNIAGTLQNTASGGPLTGLTSSGVTISGGAVNLSTVGNGVSNTGSFDMSQNSTVTITAGTIVFQNPSTAPTPVDLFIVAGGAKSITGGAFQFGSTAGTYRVDAGVTLYNLTVNANSSVQLVPATNTTSGTTYSYDLSIANQLTLNGPLQLNDQNLILGSGTPAVAGTLGANNGMIITNGTGEVRKIFAITTAYTFPVGTSAGEYSPISINFNSIIPGANPYVAVRVVNTKHPDNPNTTNFLNRYWTVRLNDITNAIYNVTATYLAGDVTGNEANIKAGEYNNSLPWTKHNLVNEINHTLTVTGIQPTGTLTSFSGIALADATTTTITSDNNPACENAQVTFTATVTTTGGSTPTGTVDFFDGTVLIGTGSLDATGIATFSTTS